MMTQAEIRRSFFDLSEQDVDDSERSALFYRAGLGKISGWDEILQSRLILILSEAQSGKTYECQARQRNLWDAGEPAFYVELASVAAQPWAQLRSPAEAARLETWRRTEAQVATIFLDSVDELGLTQGRFRTALRNVANDLDGHMARARVVLTSRPLPVDRELFISTFSAPPSPMLLTEDDFASLALGERGNDAENEAPPEVRYVSLLPLVDDDIRQLATFRGVRDVDAFILGLAKASMLDMMRRPQDVIEAAAAWRELNGKFGTHAQQVAFDIRARLKPNATRQDRGLADEQALLGAKRLALATVLTQRLTIRHDVNHDLEDPSTTVDSATILEDWRDEDRKALLERGLFGFASYGRVRFHNRLAFEFLAAERLNDLIGLGLSRKAVRRLLVVQTKQGFDVVRPSLREVAAWLSLHQSWVFDLIEGIEPALLMNCGDPGSLSVEQKCRLLRGFVERFGKGGWRGLSISQLQIHRLADPALSPIVRQNLAQVENCEVRQVLLELIGAAKLDDCAELARQIIWDPRTELNERAEALIALIALGDPELQAIAARLPDENAPWDARFARIAIYRLFPDYITVAQLLGTLAWVPETKSTGAELSRLLPPLVAPLDVAQMEELHNGLVPLVAEGLAFNADTYVATNDRPHLVHLLGTVQASLTESRALAPERVGALALTIELARGMRSNETIPPTLFNAVAKAPLDMRAALFDEALFLARRLRPNRSRLDTSLVWRGAMAIEKADAGWIRDRLEDPGTDSDIRGGALLVEMFILSPNAHDQTVYLQSLSLLVADDSELLNYLSNWLQPRESDKERRRWDIVARWEKRKEARRRASAKASWVGFWRDIKDNPAAAFEAEQAPITAKNLWRVMSRNGARSRSSGWDRVLIEAHFDKETADRLREAMMSLWRKEVPPMPWERSKEDRDLIYDRWLLALAAISAEAEDPEWAKDLEIEDAETAARYARWNGSNFPAWLDALAAAHPGSVDRTVGAEVTWVLESSAIVGSGYSVALQNVRHAPRALAELFLPRLRSWLETSSGLIREGDIVEEVAARVDQVIDILLVHGNESDRTAIRDQALVALGRGTNDPLAATWLPALFAIDPAAAVTRLEAICSDVAVSKHSNAVVWFARLFGRVRHGGGVKLRHADMTPGLLLRLVHLAYHHVDRNDDTEHEGSYSPDLRDDAEMARNAILSAVIDLEGVEGWEAKHKIAIDEKFGHLRERLRALAVEKSAAEADRRAMRPDEVIKFDTLGEPGPRTSAEMYALLVDRIEDLRDHLLEDTSPRQLWATIRDEHVMRRAIADQLGYQARRAYKVDQERVTAEEKETDIRLSSTANSIEGVIELKIGDKDYSAKYLCDAISNQLVKKYLAPAGRRSGVLLITRATRGRWQHPDTGEELNFEKLIAMLKVQARAVQENFPDEIHIDVEGLDLRPRLTTERKAKASRKHPENEVEG